MLYNDLLIFNCDGNDVEAFVVALDTRTGKERWKRDRRRPADQAYTTPLVITVNGRDQLISVGAYRAGAYDPATGREIWRVATTTASRTCRARCSARAWCSSPPGSRSRR